MCVWQVAYSLLLNTIEVISLGNPQPTLLLYHLPWLFPISASRSSPEKRPRFPRLPSAYLAVCEFVAIFSTIWNAILFLNPMVFADEERPGCPAHSCVTPEEYSMIWGYILEVVIGLNHVGFFLMAMVHFGKRKLPAWLDALEGNRRKR